MCCTVVPSVILLSHAPFRHPISPCEISPSPSSPLPACYLSSILPSVFFPALPSPAAVFVILHLRLLRTRAPWSLSGLRYGKIMQGKATMAISSYKRRFSSSLPRHLVFPPRRLSRFTPRSVSRVDKATAGSSRTLHLLDDCSRKRPDARETVVLYTTSKKKKESWRISSRTLLSYFRLMSVSHELMRHWLLILTTVFK